MLQDYKNLWPSTCHNRWMSETCKGQLVSIIIPAYNRAHLLQETLDSVWLQTYRPIELLVIDDGSTDDTKQLILEWKQKCSVYSNFEIHYFYQENRGAPAARNLGLIESRGEYIQFLDSDDVLHPQKIEIHVSALQTISKCSFAWSNYVSFTTDYEPLKARYEVKSTITQSANKTIKVNDDFLSIPMIPWMGLYTREACLATGPWNESLIRYQDIDYNIRFAGLHRTCIHIEADLYGYRSHTTGNIGDLGNHLRGIEGGLRALEAIENTIKTMKVENHEVHYFIARLYLEVARISMKIGTSEQVFLAINGASRQYISRRFMLQLQITKWIYYLLGGYICNFLLNTYTKVKLYLTDLHFFSSDLKEIS